jgi:hypothetical protein
MTTWTPVDIVGKTAVALPDGPVELQFLLGGGHDSEGWAGCFQLAAVPEGQPALTQPSEPTISIRGDRINWEVAEADIETAAAHVKLRLAAANDLFRLIIEERDAKLRAEQETADALTQRSREAQRRLDAT